MIFVVSGLVFKQISTDKLCLNLNRFMGLSQSCGLLGLKYFNFSAVLK